MYSQKILVSGSQWKHESSQGEKKFLFKGECSDLKEFLFISWLWYRNVSVMRYYTIFYLQI